MSMLLKKWKKDTKLQGEIEGDAREVSTTEGGKKRKK